MGEHYLLVNTAVSLSVFLAVFMTLFSSVAEADNTNGLIARWTFSGDANDAVGQANGVSSGISYVESLVNGRSRLVASFDGTGGLSIASGLEPFKAMGNRFTVTVWINALSWNELSHGKFHPLFTASTPNEWPRDPHQAALLTKFGPGAAVLNIESIDSYPTRVFRETAWATRKSGDQTPSSLDLPLDKWHMLVWTSDGDITSAYLNGSPLLLDYAFAPHGGSDFAPYTTFTHLFIGRDPDKTPSLFYHGLMSDLRVYNRSLSAREVAALYVAGSATRTFGESIYLAVDASSWPEAEKRAKDLGGKLVVINSKAENEFLVDSFSEYTQAFIGYTNDGVPGRWRWVDESAPTFTNWNDWDGINWSEPNNWGGNETVAMVILNGPWAGRWNDVPSGGPGIAIVELPLETIGSPEIKVEEPVANVVPNGARAKAFGNLLAGTASAGRIYTIRNTGAGPLTSIALTKVGSHTNDFTITGPGTNALAPGASTTFSVSFVPATGGTRTARISLVSNDTNNNPFVVNLTGFGIGTNIDTDKDALNDAAEFLMSGLGFNWRKAQPELVGLLASNANTAGFFSKAQYDVFGAEQFGAGRASVTNSPATHGLVSRTNIPAVRVAMPTNTPFTLNLGGTWTRYVLRGNDKAWTFNSTTGEVKGLVTGTNERNLRLTPYVGSQIGPQMIIQVRPAP
jgi:hypothetical protein